MRQATKHPHHARGVAEILLSGFCFGFLGVFGKAAYALGLSPGEFLAFRFLGASALLLLAFVAFSPSRLQVGWPAARNALLLGVFGYALFSSCYFLALRGLSVALTVLLLYTYPLWVTLGSRVFFGEHLSRRQWAILPMLFLGLVALLWGEMGVRRPLDLVLGLLSSVFYSAYILASRKFLRGVHPLASGFYVMLGAGLLLGALHVRGLPTEPQAWAVVAGTSVVSTIAAICLFLAGLQKLSGAEASMLSLAEPITAVFLGLLVFGEQLSAVQWGGAGVVLAGLAFLALAQTES